MREVLLYDPSRSPVDWTALVRRGQYAVFLTDVETSAPIQADGTSIKSAASHFCLLFDSLPEAEVYCREAISRVPRLKCEVFDSDGRANAPVAIFVNDQYEHKIDTEERARRLIQWGAVSSIASLPFFLYALWAGAEVVWWPILVGINLVFAGLRLMHWGQGLKDELKYRSDEAARRRAETDKTMR
jgi:hypothetical protein